MRPFTVNREHQNPNFEGYKLSWQNAPSVTYTSLRHALYVPSTALPSTYELARFHSKSNHLAKSICWLDEAGYVKRCLGKDRIETVGQVPPFPNEENDNKHHPGFVSLVCTLEKGVEEPEYVAAQYGPQHIAVFRLSSDGYSSRTVSLPHDLTEGSDSALQLQGMASETQLLVFVQRPRSLQYRLLDFSTGEWNASFETDRVFWDVIPFKGGLYLIGNSKTYQTPDAAGAEVALSISNGAHHIAKESQMQKYAWEQSEDEICIDLPLEDTLSKDQVRFELADRRRVKISVQTGTSVKTLLDRSLFYSVNSAVWTLQDMGRTLALHVFKEEDVVKRWPHPFEFDDGVDEGVAVRDQKTGGGQSDMCLGQGSTAHHGLSDSQVFAGIGSSGLPSNPSHHQLSSEGIEEDDGLNCIVERWAIDGRRFERQSCDEISRNLVIVQDHLVGLAHDVDVLLMDIRQGVHIDTVDAFNFVQASKRDKRFLLVSMRDNQLLWGAVVAHRRYVLIYTKAGKQFVITLEGKGADGADVDIFGARVRGEKLFVLTRRSLVCIEVANSV